MHSAPVPQLPNADTTTGTSGPVHQRLPEKEPLQKRQGFGVGTVVWRTFSMNSETFGEKRSLEGG